MKLGYWSRVLPLRSFCDSTYSNGVRVLLFSTKTLTSPSSSDSLLERVLPIVDPKASIAPVLDKWIEEGNFVRKSYLQFLVRKMQDFRRFQHALEISKWMSDRRYMILTDGDVAVRLDLIFKLHGLKRAEEYFDSISKPLKGVKPYGALMYCFCKEKCVEKAEAHFEEMKKLGYVTTPFVYNLLINLYTQTRQCEKIKTLMQEMESNGIPHDKYTLVNWLNAYVTESDVDGMERTLNQIEKDPGSVTWYVYSIMANGYLKVGLMDKALKMMEKVEKMTIKRKTKVALEYIVTFYAKIGEKGEVYRIWDLFKSAGRLQNSSYSAMITCLAKLGDLEGAEKIFKEWECSGARVDFRVLNRLISAYSRNGLFEEAESLINRTVEKAAESEKAPYASTWSTLAIGYVEHKKMPKAVEMSKKALLVGRRGWKLNPSIVQHCLEYFEEQRDVGEAEEFVKLLRTAGPLTQEVYHMLLRTYVAAKKPASDVLNRMNEDGFCVNDETLKILETNPDAS